MSVTRNDEERIVHAVMAALAPAHLYPKQELERRVRAALAARRHQHAWEYNDAIPSGLHRECECGRVEHKVALKTWWTLCRAGWHV